MVQRYVMGLLVNLWLTELSRSSRTRWTGFHHIYIRSHEGKKPCQVNNKTREACFKMWSSNALCSGQHCILVTYIIMSYVATLLSKIFKWLFRATCEWMHFSYCATEHMCATCFQTNACTCELDFYPLTAPQCMLQGGREQNRMWSVYTTKVRQYLSGNITCTWSFYNKMVLQSILLFSFVHHPSAPDS
jgi:hypothetical protein